MQYQHKDYGITARETPIMCDNTSAIAISQNPVHHSRSKHIELRHYFIRDHVERKDIVVEKFSTEYNLVDIFTKPLCVSRFANLRGELCMLY